jgi:tetratricopeptide (TPR) repeat protein
MKQLFAYVLLALILALPADQAIAEEEWPITLPKSEGSKSFDLEIDEINSLGVKTYHRGNYEKAVTHFKKALNLSLHLRDPSQGVLYFNLAIALHKTGMHEEATKNFYSARRLARGNKKILHSELLEMHDCGLNPSVPCKKKPPLSLNIEGSH